MTTRGLAFKYAKGQLRGDLDNFAEAGRGTNTVHSGHHGSLLAMHSSAPPSVAEYDEWLASYRAESDPHGRGCQRATGAKLRRMVIMRRQGSGLAEINRATGLAKQWFEKLPEGLNA